MLHRLRKWVSRFLQRIADQNQRQFGSQRMDCCQLNQRRARKPAADTSRKPEA